MSVPTTVRSRHVAIGLLLSLGLAFGVPLAAAGPANAQQQNFHYTPILKFAGAKAVACLAYTPNADPAYAGYTVYLGIDAKKSRSNGLYTFTIYQLPTTIQGVPQPMMEDAHADGGWFAHEKVGKTGGFGIYSNPALYTITTKMKGHGKKTSGTVGMSSIGAC